MYVVILLSTSNDTTLFPKLTLFNGIITIWKQKI
jgi:hypothetical protein